MIRNPKLWLLVLAGATVSFVVWRYAFPGSNAVDLFLVFFGLPGTFAGLLAAHARPGSQCAVIIGIAVAVVANSAFFWCLFMLISRWQRKRDNSMPSMLNSQAMRPVSKL